MPSVDELLASSPLAGLRRVSASGGDRKVALVRLAESFTDLDRAPAASLVILSKFASAEVSDYRLDMALRWGAIHQVAALAAFSAAPWRPTVTARDIAARAGIALIFIPAGMDMAVLLEAVMHEIGGDAERALGRAKQGLDAVLAAGSSGGGLEDLRAAVSMALGTTVEFRPCAADGAVRGRPAANGGPGASVTGGSPGPRETAGGSPGVPAAGGSPAARETVADRGGAAHDGLGGEVSDPWWSAIRRSGGSSRRMRTATSGPPSGWSCTARR